MAKQTIENGDQMLEVKDKINENFTEQYKYEKKSFSAGSGAITISGFTTDVTNCKFDLFIDNLNVSVTSYNMTISKSNLFMSGYINGSNVIGMGNMFGINYMDTSDYESISFNRGNNGGGVILRSGYTNSSFTTRAYIIMNIAPDYYNSTITITFTYNGAATTETHSGGYIIVHPATIT